MSMRVARLFVAIVTISAPWAALAQTRGVVTSEGSDYFGFDLRTERDVSLEDCKSICLADAGCRAFTYNTNAQWCFLKSDYNLLNPFAGAVAGKVVDGSGDPDIGAPPALSFLPDSIADETRLYRAELAASAQPDPSAGLETILFHARDASSAGDPRDALPRYAEALAISPDDSALWTALAQAAVAVQPQDGEDLYPFQLAGTSAAYQAYQLSRGASARAGALAVLARALERRGFFRPALNAYQASLELVDSAEVQAAYAELRSTKGFRVVEHRVEADAVSPRICVQLSEPLVKSGVDYASYLTLDGGPANAIEASGSQICIEGLEHGENYRVALRAGLPAAIGETLQSAVTLNIYIRDRAPAVRFTGDNFVLPATARRGVPVVTVNADTVAMKLFRVGDRAISQVLSGSQFLRQLDGYDAQRIADELGMPVWEGVLEVASERNKEVVTSFPVDEALPQRKPGIYVLTAEAEGARRETWDPIATQWFTVSDIGLSTFAGSDGLHVFARSLGGARPLASVELQLLARNNEILGTAITDEDGRAVFTAGLTRGNAGMAPAALLATLGNDDDFVFLDMTRAGFDLSDRGVGGRAAPGALDVLAWTERGIYRAGETVHVAALARDASAEAVEALPLTFLFRRPDGVEDRRLVSDGAALGGHALSLDLPDNAMLGTWAVTVLTDPESAPVAETQFLVEDFAPDRIEFDLTSAAQEIATGEAASIDVDGRFLYGAPATGLSLEGEIRISTTRELDGFPGYQFGLADEEAEEETRIPLENLPLLGEDGKARFDVRVDALPASTQLLAAQVVVRMREGSGRAVERSVDLAIQAESPVIGIDPQFEDGQVRENSTAAFNVIAVGPSGERRDLAGLAWSLVKIERQYQWYREGAGWNYEPVEFTSAVADGTIDASATAEAQISMLVEWGRYRLEVSSADAAGPASSVDFEVGWHVETASTETPDGLEIALDKESYAAGETAKLQVSPRFAGELLITVGADRLLGVQMASVPQGGAVIDLPVGNGWGAGAYVTATLYRPGAARESRMPMRAIGVKWLGVDPAERKLDVSLQPPEKTEPRQVLDIPISVAGLAAGDIAYVMVAAVDVGILNLTGYQAPDPEAWYFGQRQLGFEIRDLYGRLIDGSLGAAGRIRTGGDGGSMVSQGSPPKEKLVAFFSGPVHLDAEGKAIVSFDIPQFNGTVRVMAVAWTKTGVGHAATDVVIRDPVVVTASLPKFLAPGDRSELRLDIANTDGPAGEYALAVSASDSIAIAPGTVPATINLSAGQRLSLVIPVAGQKLGEAAISVSLVHGGGLPVAQALDIPVRPAALPVTTRTTVTLAANGGSLRIDRELLGASLLDGASVSIGVARASAFDVPALLMALDRYPYGCAEQTTSVAMPLLYLDELSADAGLVDDPAIRQRVQDAIHNVLAYQSSSGSFGLWSPGSGDLWLDAYVTDFLTRARERTYEVPEQSMRAALENLQNSLAYEVDVAANGAEIAYALYVLARNRRASAGDLRYYADTQLEAFATPLARAQLAAGLSLYGDSGRAETAFRSAFSLAQDAAVAANPARSDYGSPLRDGAAMLALAVETRPLPPLVPEMVRLVAAADKRIDHTSTQEQAWMLLAARAFHDNSDGISLDVNGGRHDGRFARRLAGEELLASPVTVVNRSAEPLEATVTTIAAPLQPLPAGGDGFAIERTYYAMDGTPANVSVAAQNERFVAVLSVSELNSWPSRVLVTDLLPAGFEIDNPRIVASADLQNFDWLGPTEIAHAEFRSDRFVAAFDRTEDSARDFTVAYVVRAVTPGAYAHPAASVEDMYRPELSARTATGWMEVKAAAR